MRNPFTMFAAACSKVYSLIKGMFTKKRSGIYAGPNPWKQSGNYQTSNKIRGSYRKVTTNTRRLLEIKLNLTGHGNRKLPKPIHGFKFTRYHFNPTQRRVESILPF